MNKFIAVGAIGVGSVLLAAPAAFAAPQNGPEITSATASCPSYTGPITLTPSGATWVPAFGANHQVLIPIAFGEETDVFTPSDPTAPVDTQVVPPVLRTGQRKGQLGRAEECTYSLAFAAPEGTFTVSGSATVVVVGKPTVL